MWAISTRDPCPSPAPGLAADQGVTFHFGLGVGLLLYACALLSKETALVLPLALLLALLCGWERARPGRRASWWRWLAGCSVLAATQLVLRPRPSFESSVPLGHTLALVPSDGDSDWGGERCDLGGAW